MANITRIKTIPGVMISAGIYTLMSTYKDIDLELLSNNTIIALQEEYEAKRIEFEDYTTFKAAYDVIGSSGGGTVVGAATSAKQDEIIVLLDAQATLAETQPVSITSAPLPAGAATEAKQDALLTELQSKSDGTDTEPTFTTSTSQVQTPTFERVNTAGIVAAGAIQVSITNVGEADGTVLTGEIKPQETVRFTVTDRNATLPDVSYSAIGTEFVITTLRGV